MSKKHQADAGGFVYSTDPSFRKESSEQSTETLPAGQQRLRIRLETKHRGGKTVTVVDGFIGREADLESLGKLLKSHCGSGGAVKDGEIIVQGDHREKIRAWLLKAGYPAK